MQEGSKSYILNIWPNEITQSVNIFTSAKEPGKWNSYGANFEGLVCNHVRIRAKCLETGGLFHRVRFEREGFVYVVR